MNGNKSLENDTASESATSDGSAFKDFISKRSSLLVVLAFTVLAMLIIGSLWDHTAPPLPKSAPPVITRAFSQCKVNTKQYIPNKIIYYYIDSSCGFFNADKDAFQKVEEGGVYDFETYQPEGEKRPWVSAATAPS